MLTLLTATGGRPAAFALLEKMMLAQTYAGPVKWIVVDDVFPAQPVTFNREGWELCILSPGPLWKPGDNTQARNLLAGLAHVSADAKLVIVEDDDHYKADWLEVVDKWLDRAELVGECEARYYNVATKQGRQLSNRHHASLCSTAMRGDAIKAFRDVCRTGAKFIDIELWRKTRSRMLFTGNRVTGIKGMPGRGGIGMGHKRDFRGQHDPDGKLLRSWIGANAEWYL